VRVVEEVARTTGLTPVEWRRRNFARSFPYRLPTGSVLDSGDYDQALTEALRRNKALPGERSKRAHEVKKSRPQPDTDHANHS